MVVLLCIEIGPLEMNLGLFFLLPVVQGPGTLSFLMPSGKSHQESRPNKDVTEPASEASDVLSSTSLSLAGHELPPREAVSETLAQFTQLRRLDVSNIQASDTWPHGLKDLLWLAKAVRQSRKVGKRTGQAPLHRRLTWLNLSGNAALGDSDGPIDGLDLLPELCVLNASHCTLRAFPPALGVLSNLKALVLSHNAIAALPATFPHMPELNTLVLSHNDLKALPKTMPASVPNLKKLSLGHNALSCDGIPDFQVCSHLREVRLNGNTQLGVLPPHIAAWGRGVDGGAPGLVLLDVSDCGLQDWDAVEPLLERPTNDMERHGLVNLSAKGNPIAGDRSYSSRLCEALPSLRILDNVRLHAPKATLKEPAETIPSKRKEVEPASEPAPLQDDGPKKARKRSGRGPKKTKKTLDIPAAEPEAPRRKKIRRKKTTKAVEMDMDMEIPPAAPVRSAEPEDARSEPAPSGVVQVVQVNKTRTKPAASAAALLGKRQDDTALDGW